MGLYDSGFAMNTIQISFFSFFSAHLCEELFNCVAYIAIFHKTEFKDKKHIFTSL